MRCYVNDQANSPHGFPTGRGVSLSDRVRSLRIQDRPAAQPVGRWWLPCEECAIFAGAAPSSAARPTTVDVPAPADDALTKVTGLAAEKPVAEFGGPTKGLSPEAV